MNLSLIWFYPDLMDTYGDRGNILCLIKRAGDRGIAINLHTVSLNNTDVLTGDILFMGGAQDRQQRIVLHDLHTRQGEYIKRLVNEGTPGLFVCAGYQLMGEYYQPAEGEKIPGLGLFDLYTKHFGSQQPRLIGNHAAKLLSLKNLERATIVGFENHGGRTFLGSTAQALASVRYGYGNNGQDGTEGVILKNTLGSYLHGPLLPKNPHLADYLLLTALQRKYGNNQSLKPLNDTIAWIAHEKAYAQAQHGA
jgi:lipid II isoglutaminyl synthase (glutamine-hydrolysing)